ncbi:MAG: hypothetical protein AB7S52_00115 [Sphaerochaetaceae bacterium]
MKKTIVLIAVLLLVVGTAFAAPTFSGNFGFDYVFFLDGDIATSGYDGTAGAADISLSLSDDFYSIDFRNSIDGEADLNEKDWYVTTTVKASEILKTVDIELPVTLDVLVGNQNFFSESAYTDPSGAEGDNYSLSSNSVVRANIPFGVTVGLEGIGSATTGYDLLGEGVFAGATITPVDGVSLAGAVVNDATFDLYSPGGKAMTASAAVDIDAFVGLDFDLSVAGSTWIAFEVDDQNLFFAAVTGGKDAVSGYVEYINEQTVSNMNVGAGFQVSDASKLSVGVGVSDLGGDNTLDAYVKGTYTIAGITTFVEYGFDNNGEASSDHYIQTGLDFSF